MSDRLEEIRAGRTHPNWPTPHQGDWLIAEVDRLRAENAQLRKRLQQVECYVDEVTRLRAALDTIRLRCVGLRYTPIDKILDIIREATDAR